MGRSNEATWADIRLILFDLDGTIQRASPTFHTALMGYAAELGETFDEEAQRAGMRWSQTYWANSPRLDEHPGAREIEAPWIDYSYGYLQALGVPKHRAEALASPIGKQFQADYRPEFHLAPGAKELLWSLRTQRYTLGLVSNRREPITGIAIELGIIEHFNFTLSAGQVGSWKPDPTIFHHALALGGRVSPDESVFVGDNYHTDVIGAQRAGIHAILLDEHDLFPEGLAECVVIRQLGELRDIFVSQ